MKKIRLRGASILVSAALLCSLGTGAIAETQAGETPAVAIAETASDTLDVRLASITQLVKTALGVDTGVYTQFYGDCYDQMGGTSWDLNWSAEDGSSLSVTANDDGVVTWYNYDPANNDNSSKFYGFQTAFPAHTEAEAQKVGEAFLEKVMGKNESARVDEVDVNLTSDNQTYYLRGTLLMNGLETPVTFNCRVGADSLAVENYNRSDSYRPYVGSPDSPDTGKIAQADAQALLQDATQLELLWVLDENGQAELQYVPQAGNYAVDAGTGELTDMDALYEAIGDAYKADVPAAEAAMAYDTTAGGLTQVEQDSIANLEDVTAAETLDKALRAIPALGLNEDFTYTSSYTMNRETGEITCSMNYTCPVNETHSFGVDADTLTQYAQWGESLFVYKFYTLDAKTGALQSCTTNAPGGYSEEDRQDAETLQSAAEAFLQAYGSQEAQGFALYTQADGTFCFAQTEQGYYFPGNSVNVTLNPVTGTVDSLYYVQPEEDVTFGAAENLLTPEAALEAYYAAGAVALRYISWPLALDPNDPVLAVYLDYGYGYVEKLTLAYTLGFEEPVVGIDAHTGAAVTNAWSEAEYAYTDLEGAYGQAQIEALAEAGIGLPGGTFRPTEAITQRQLCQLLLSACGYGELDGDDETVQNEAAWYGFIRKTDWNPDSTLTRMEVLKAILNASEYGKAAALPGAYRCTFGDEAAIDAADYGYVSIGQALGMVHGDGEGTFSAYTSCTRQDAAIMLYNFMMR